VKIAFLIGFTIGLVIGALVPPLGSLVTAMFAGLAALVIVRLAR
jgi:hypothetical protein